jgi:chlorite dismutase
MPEETPQTLNLFAFFHFSDAYYSLPSPDRLKLNQNWLADLQRATDCLWLYQVYPAHNGADILAWSAQTVEDPSQPERFFTDFARSTNPYRNYIQPVQTLWGFTRPSLYTKTRSTQEIDPFSKDRQPYLVIYPFVKTTEWYLLGRETRQGMMNEHIRIGKQYPQITQLLLYSFGLQDQEFVVVYETADLALFSALVQELRSTDGRIYTQRDTPLATLIFHPAEEILALWA